MKKKRAVAPMFSLDEAAQRGIERVYQPNWSNPLDHIKIDLMPDGSHGPWVHLYSPYNQKVNGRDPVNMLWGMGMDTHSKCLYAYAGPLPDSDEYKADAASYGHADVSERS
jgi:hypothetical protein